jgi:hypothetical protein
MFSVQNVIGIQFVKLKVHKYVPKVRAVAISVAVLAAGVVLFGPGAPSASAATGETALYSGQALYPGQAIVSSGNGYKLLFQSDGNLVMYKGSSPYTAWQSHTYAENAAFAVMQTDGNFVIRNYQGQPLWSTGTGGNPGARLVIQGDSNLVVYTFSSRPLWSIGRSYNTTCWHTYHYNDVTYGGWITTGHVRMSADVCNDGSDVWLQATAHPLQCWTDNGFVGTAWVTACVPYYWQGHLGVEARMHIHKDAGIQAGIISIPFSIDADAYVSSQVNAWNTSEAVTGGVGVLWLDAGVH